MIKSLLILSYLIKEGFDAVINYLNDTYQKRELPDNVKDVYDADEYKKWMSYEKDNGRVRLVGTITSAIITLLFLIFNVHSWGFGLFDGFNVYVQYAMFTVTFSLALSIVDIPFSYYSTFVIEEKYGMNKSTKKTFVLDWVKEQVLSNLLSILILFVIMFIYDKFGNKGAILIIVAIIAISALLVLIVMPILKLFNKFEPLEDGELKTQLLALCDKYNVKVKRIVVKDASRRTTKSNAFCTGLGKKKTISIDDNLIENYSVEEIVAVFAHEFAHAKYKHVLKSLPLGIAVSVLNIVFLVIVFNISAIYTSFGFDKLNYMFAMLALDLIVWPIGYAIGILNNYLSRKHEYEADAFAAREGYGDALISSLKRLHSESLSGINPHPIDVLLSYSHPTLSQRIDAIKNIK